MAEPASIWIARVRPWLGTLVEIRVASTDAVGALAAIDAAFARIAALHHRLSFHAADSELAHLNREAARRAVRVHPDTATVLRAALCIAADSQGAFDPTIAARLVERGALPAPDASPADASASWQDVRIDAADRVLFRRPLWLDLGGIAKGHAVDCAVATLRERGIAQGIVNAGGDLRVFGHAAEVIHLRGTAADTGAPALELADGAVATSSAQDHPPRDEPLARSAVHLHGRRRRRVPPGRTVAVLAARCMIADALTKVLMADPIAGRLLLPRYAASACIHDRDGGWRLIEGHA